MQAAVTGPRSRPGGRHSSCLLRAFETLKKPSPWSLGADTLMSKYQFLSGHCQRELARPVTKLPQRVRQWRAYRGLC